MINIEQDQKKSTLKEFLKFLLEEIKKGMDETNIQDIESMKKLEEDFSLAYPAQ